MSNYRLMQGDCLEMLNEIPDSSVDLLLTDPPYNISKDNNFSTMKSANRQGLDFGEWDREFDLTSWIALAAKKVREGGNIVVFNAWRNLGTIDRALESNNCVSKDIIRMIKNNPMPRNRDRRFIVDYEFAVWAVKKKGKWTFNRIDEKYERPEVRVNVTPKSEKKFGSHPTQKPLDAMKWIIERLSNSHDTVLDCFMGSGSTGVAALELDRNFVGIELDKDYFDIAKKRIEEINAKAVAG